jgi:hypothetical protein
LAGARGLLVSGSPSLCEQVQQGEKRPHADGFRRLAPADNLGLHELDSLLSPEDTAILQSLTMNGHAYRVKFMG